MGAGKPTVSVVVCAWTEERVAQTLECVEAIQEQTVEADEVIVVVDGNSALLTVLSRALRGTALVIANPGERGSGNARNAGMSVAQGDLAAFVDDDGRPARDWIATFVRHFERREVLGVGGSIELIWAAGRPIWFPREFDWAVGGTYEGLPVLPTAVRNLMAGNMIARRALVMEAGGFRISKVGAHFAGPEEHELCIRVQRANPYGVWLYDPDVHVFHHVPPNRSSFAYFRYRCVAEGELKAELVSLVGTDVGLSAERAHIVGALCRGILSELAASASQRNLGGVKRAAAIVIGLGYTVFGYVKSHGKVWTCRVRPACRSADNPSQPPE